MNDWLNYKGSGSIRANANTLEHSASIPNGRKINSIRGNAVEAATKVRDANAYNRLNAELDSLYSDLSATITAYNNARAGENQFYTAARNAKAKYVIYNTRGRNAQDKCWAMYSKIEKNKYNLSDMQYTALMNKINNMAAKAEAAMAEGKMETEVHLNTLESVISEMTNNSQINFKPRR